MGQLPITPVDTKPRIKTLPPERPGESCVYRSAHLADDQPLIQETDPKITTLYEIMLNSSVKFADNNCLGWREGDTYKWIKYAEVFNRAKTIGSGLLQHLKPGDMVGLASINRLEWNLTEHACNAFSIALVPLYDTLGRDACIHIIKECRLSVIVCSNEKVKSFLSLAKDVPIKTIISYAPPKEEDVAQAKELDVLLTSLDVVEDYGKQNPAEVQPPKPDDICTICYTSGTTGVPKGVIVTHRNMIASVAGIIFGEIEVNDKDIHISYLPSAHSFERVISTGVMLFGASMGYYSGDAKKLFEDIAVLKPTLFVTVPRLLGRLYDKVMEAINIGGITQPLFEKAYQDKLENLRKGYLTHAVYDNLVFSKIKGKLGGNVRFIITGSAPLAPNLMDFLRVCFCCPVLEGYGQTETCVGGTRTLLWDTDTGHVGVPTPAVELKLVDVPAMNYFASDEQYPKGEVCFRGPTCTSGYYNNSEKTKELIDEHGWLRSGDVGMILPNGNLKLIDRVKNIFKLSQGEYIAPEKIEQVLNQCKWVAQSFIYGESLKSALIGVIVPDHEVLGKWSEDTNHPQKGDYAALCADEKVNKMILDDLLGVAKKQDLKPFEWPRKIYVSPTPFTVDNDTLTPTFKLKRPQASTMYKQQLEEMYKDIE